MYRKSECTLRLSLYLSDIDSTELYYLYVRVTSLLRSYVDSYHSYCLPRDDCDKDVSEISDPCN